LILVAYDGSHNKREQQGLLRHSAAVSVLPSHHSGMYAWGVGCEVDKVLVGRSGIWSLQAGQLGWLSGCEDGVPGNGVFEI